eukprot:scaffold12185_cov61-Phaeocystis_antarctica.AAC.3
MIRIAPATLANPKPPDAGLGGAPGSKANNQHTKLNQAITPPRAPRTARSPYLSESPPGAPPRHKSNPNLLKPHAPAQPHSVASLARLASLYA